MSNSEKIKANLNENASFLLYLLQLFDGKITIAEMKEMDYSLLIALKESKEKETIEEQKRIEHEKNQMQIQQQSKSTIIR